VAKSPFKLPKPEKKKKEFDITNKKTWPYPLKLNLGSGDELYLEGFINIDLHTKNKVDLRADVKDLSMFEDNSVDEIFNSHLIEHFDFYDGLKAMKEWYRVLKPGGKLIVECPDLLGVCKLLLEIPVEEHPKYYAQLFGCPWVPGHAHLFGYSKPQLRWTFETIGFKNLQELRPMRFVNCESFCQCLMGEK
jgi:SAM-dependent methyltransferase